MSVISIGGAPVAIGDRVVYPSGGICRVKGVESKVIAGQPWVMLMLTREEDGATVMVNQSKVDTIGLRKVASGDAIAVLFDFFTSSSADPELDWKVRHRENFEKMAAGGLLDTAGVLKGLHALAQLRPLPTKERELYDNARHLLVGEIAASLNLPMAVAEDQIDYALNPPPGSGRAAPKDLPLDLKSLRRSLSGSARRGLAGDLGLGEEEEEETTDPLLAGLEDEGEGEMESGTAEAGAGNEDEEPDEEAPARPAKSEKAKERPAPKGAVPGKEPARAMDGKALKSKEKPAEPETAPQLAPKPGASVGKVVDTLGARVDEAAADVVRPRPVAKAAAASPTPAATPAPAARAESRPPPAILSDNAAQKALSQKSPAKVAPVEKTPAEKAPAKAAPVEKTPAEKAPAKAAPAKAAPAKATPAKAAPAKAAPVKAAPAKAAPVKAASRARVELEADEKPAKGAKSTKVTAAKSATARPTAKLKADEKPKKSAGTAAKSKGVRK
jgi:RNA polymerase-interacting CarD/CdnL/TRCF family regulator